MYYVIIEIIIAKSNYKLNYLFSPWDYCIILIEVSGIA